MLGENLSREEVYYSENTMIHNNNNLKIFYDEEADVLYITNGNPEYTDYVEYTDDVILRFEPDTKKLVGFTIIDFSRHFAKKEPDIHLPFGVNFQFTEEQVWATTPE